jgi:enoyl-CoA hydratase/carnithine racemase
MTPEQLASVGLRYAETGPVATITLDRPEVRNAQTPAMWRALGDLGAQIPDSVRVVVVTGEGPTFSAGLDKAMLDPRAAGGGTETVAGLLAGTDEEISATIDAYQQGFTFLRDPRFVSIAAVRGYAVGAGFQLALSCDLRVVADDVQFCMKEAALGLVPDLTGTKPLVEAVGYSRALEICATARMVGAQEAVRIGLAQASVPSADLDAAVAELVGALTAPLPGAVRETKKILQGASERDLDDQRRLEREAQVRRFREIARISGQG